MTNDYRDLNDFIDNHQSDSATQPTNADQAFAADLMALADQQHLDPAFDAALAARFQTQSTTPAQPRRVAPRRLSIAAAVTLLLAIVATLAVPDLRAIAQDILDDLFPREPEPTRTITYTEFAEGDIQWYDDANSAQIHVPYPIRELGLIPNGMQMDEVGFLESRNVVSMIFFDDRFTYQDIRFQQQPIAGAQEHGYFWYTFDEYTIGQNADVQTVMVGDNEGQLVRGFWMGDGQDTFAWDNDFPFFHLRWQDGTMAYELRVNTRPSLFDLDELITIAESIE